MHLRPTCFYHDTSCTNHPEPVTIKSVGSVASLLSIPATCLPFLISLELLPLISDRLKQYPGTMATAGQTPRQPQKIRYLKVLDKQLYRKRVGKHPRFFVPANWIEAFSTREVIVRVLEEERHLKEGRDLNKDKVLDPEQLAEQILRHQAQRLFLLTIQCDRVEWLKEWLDDWLAVWQAVWLKPPSLKPSRSPPGLSWLKNPCLRPFGDRHLPVAVGDDSDWRALCSMDSVTGQPEPPSWLTRSSDDTDETNAMTSFATHQWSLLAPVFTKDKFHYELHESVPLPFLTKIKTEADGAFSDMFEVTLHGAHQQVITPKASNFDPLWRGKCLQLYYVETK